MVDTASSAPLKKDTSHRDSHEAAVVLLRAAEEVAFAEAPFYAGGCHDSCALANDIINNAAHLTDRCAHCSACVSPQALDIELVNHDHRRCSVLHWLGSAEGGILISRSHRFPVAAQAAQMRCARIELHLLPTGSLLVGIINGLLLLIIAAGFAVSGVGYGVAISSVMRDFLVGQSDSAGTGAIRDAFWRARDRDAEPR